MSPDARWLAYLVDVGSNRSLIVRDLLNDSASVLIPSISKSISYYDSDNTNQHFCFSPDSKYIYISYKGKIHKISVINGNDKIIPFSTTVNVDLGPLDYNTFSISQEPFKVKYTRFANSSPNGKHLVFCALNTLYTMDLPNGKPHLLMKQPYSQYQPTYSPDNQWIAFVSWQDSEGGFIWKIPAKGGRPKKLIAKAGQYQRPQWSPDGKYIAVIKGEPILGDRDEFGTGELILIPTNGDQPLILAKKIPLWNQISFSVDGKTIYYSPYPKGKGDSLSAQMVSQHISDNKIDTVAWGRSIGWLPFYQHKTVSPDGNYIVFVLAEDLFLVPIKKNGQRTILYNEEIPTQAIRFAQGVDPYWENEGKTICWNYGGVFYKSSVSKIISNAKESMLQKTRLNVPDSNFITVITSPDQEIDINLKIKSKHGYNKIAIKNARIITMNGDQVIDNGSILVQNGRIKIVGKNSDVKIPSDAKIIDATGTTIIPGLIDLHSHTRNPSDIFPQQSWMYQINLAYGVTTLRDPSNSFDSFGYAELLRSGKMIGPRLFTVGRAIKRLNDMRINSLEDAKSFIGQRKLFHGTVIKQYDLGTRLQRQWLLIASREAGLNLTNEGGFDPIIQIAMMKDGCTGIEHSPVWGDVYNDVIEFAAKSQTWLTPTLQIPYGNKAGAETYLNKLYWSSSSKKIDAYMPQTEIQRIKQANNNLDANEKPIFEIAGSVYSSILKIGGHIGLGSHGENQGIGVHNELWALQLCGMTNFQALRIATLGGAEGLGIQRDLGSIENGKIADLIILNKNPLEDIHNSREIRYIMKDGILYNSETLKQLAN